MAHLSVKSFDSSKLHLVIWNRIEPTHHKAAIEAFSRIMNKPYANEVMPLIRPLGRKSEDYKQYQSPDRFCKAEFTQLDATPILDGVHTAHCEIWFQVSSDADHTLRSDIVKEFCSIDSTCYFWDHINPVWAPFGQDLYSCQYASSRNSNQDRLVCSLCDERVALLLKIIWYRASQEILKLLAESDYIPLDPRTEKRKIHDLMESIFADIDLKQLGITTDSCVIDPTEFGVSHMAAFAVNSITIVNSWNNIDVYQLEQYYQNKIVTHPYSLTSRGAFLKLFE